MSATQTPHTQQSQATPATTFTPDELARRRASSRRLAWLLGALALGIYLVGLFFKR